MGVTIIQIPVGPMANFAYLVMDSATKKAAVVDPGWEPDKILAMAAEIGAKIEAIWLTHTHFDHVRAIPDLVSDTGAPIWVHPLERPQLEGQTGTIHDLQDGDVLKLGQTQVQVLHTPGHSPGAVCFHIGDQLITGDTLFVGAIGRTDLPGSDPRAMGKSLKRLAQLPDETIVYSGHDYGDQKTSTIGREKKTNPYMNL